MGFSRIFLLTLFTFTYGSNVEYDGWLNIKLLHSFGTNGIFVPRGNLTIQSVRSGGFTLEQNPLSPKDLDALKDLAKSDDFYQLKSISSGADGTDNVFLSSVKAESLLETGLHDCITVWFLHNGAVVGVGLAPSKMETFQSTSPDTDFKLSNSLTTEVYLKHMDQAPVPDTASYIQKLEREREAREKGDFKDNRSFIAKYWMYIVPVAIFVLLSGAANPEQTAAR